MPPPPLTPGRRLGPYEIVAPVGSGGMGDVYRARDTRLGRTVALKVLPSDLAADPAARSRFEREARAVSGLDHPRICALFDVGREQGVDFLVMQFLEGETLAELLRRGPLPLADALAFGVHLADALDAAHQRGIVHRDLKPANVMVTDSGARLLDFGIAKPLSLHGGAADRTATAVQVTGTGHAIGTVQYMAPEQLEGRDVDHRTDIYALGLVLYEMIAGRRPAAGGVLQPLTTVRPETPRHVAHIVDRCLAQKPHDRWQSARDLREELAFAAANGADRATAPAVRARRWPLLAAGTILTLAAGAAIGVMLARRDGPTPAQAAPFKLTVATPAGVRLSVRDAIASLAVSPDGQWIAFVGESDDPRRRGIYVRALNAHDSQLVPGTQSAASAPFFSPDSKWLAFYVNEKIQKMPLAGGPIQEVCAARRLRGASWTADGTIVFSATDRLLRVPATGGEPEEITTPAPGQVHHWPVVLPGGRAALFAVTSGMTDRWRKIAYVWLDKRDGGAVHEITSGTHPKFTGPDHLFFARHGFVYRAAFDPVTMTLSGEPVEVAKDVGDAPGSGYTAFDVASDGTIVYTAYPSLELADRKLGWLDLQGQATELGAVAQPYRSPAASADGTRIAVHVAATADDSDVWVYDTTRNTITRLTNGLMTLGPIVWASDDRTIITSSRAQGFARLVRVRADPGSPAEFLTAEGGVTVDYAGGLGANGRLFFHRFTQASFWDVMSMPLDPRGPVTTFAATPRNEQSTSVSADGRWVAYSRDGAQIVVEPSQGARAVHVISDDARRPSWSKSEATLFYQKGNDVWSVTIAPGAEFRAGAATRRFAAPFDLDRLEFGASGRTIVAMPPSGDHPPPQLTVMRR